MRGPVCVVVIVSIWGVEEVMEMIVGMEEGGMEVFRIEFEIVVVIEAGVRVEKPAVEPEKVADSVMKTTVTSCVVVCVVAARMVVVCAAAAGSNELVSEARVVAGIGRIEL